MKYPWVTIAILGIWFASAIVLGARKEVDPVAVYVIMMIATVSMAFIGFRSPRM